MTEDNKIAQAKILLKKLPFLSEQDIQDLPNTKIAFWLVLSKLVRKNINYAFDEDSQTTYNKIFDQLDQILGTKKSSILKKQGLKKLESFPEILTRITNWFTSQVQRLQESGSEMENIQQNVLETVFEREIPRWTYTQLNELIQRKLQKYEDLKNENKLNTFQALSYTACQHFNEEIGDLQDIDFELVDRLITIRISQKDPIQSLNTSMISQKSSDESITVEDKQLKDLQTSLEGMELVSEESSAERTVVISEVKKQEKSNVFLKKENKFLSELEEIPVVIAPKVEIKVEKKEEKKEEEPKREAETKPLEKQSQPVNSDNNKIREQELLPIFRTNRPVPLKQDQQERKTPNTPKTETQQTQQNKNNLQFEVSFTSINDSFFKTQDTEINQRFSQQLIERYSSQSRFTFGKYEFRREAEVRQIEQNQLRPLLDLLRTITNNSLDKFSPNYNQIGVELYGSYANKTGFRKTSDININLTIRGVGNMHSTLFGLRNLLDTHRKRGTLNTLRLRSVIYSQQHQEVILSHENNRTKPKTRQPGAVNFIYLTINRFDYTLSSQFMKQVIYSGKDKATDIANLTNILHLCFKGNNILDYKDMYHTWWTDTPEDVQKKQLSQRYYVTIPIYAMHMMVLYYLKEMLIISKIYISQETKQYDFELLNPNKTLFEMFVGFLKFYSSQGGYVSDHSGVAIDVVENRSPNVEQKIVKLFDNNSQVRKYLFVIIHPRAEDLVKSTYGENANKLLSYHIKHESSQQKLFFEKIDSMLKTVENLKPEDNFDPNELFQWNRLQHDY